MAISAGLFLPTTWLPDLGALSYVGALGVVSALALTGHLLKITSSVQWVLCQPMPLQLTCLSCPNVHPFLA